MIHIYIDYDGDKEDATSYTDTGAEYQAKLDELESHKGGTGWIEIYIGRNKAESGWEEYPKRILVKTTNAQLAVKRGRLIKYPQ